MPFALRAATPEDADAIAGVLTASFRLLNFLPMLHTAEEDRRFIANVVLRDCAVTVAEDETGSFDDEVTDEDELGDDEAAYDEDEPYEASDEDADEVDQADEADEYVEDDGAEDVGAEQPAPARSGRRG